MRYISIPIIVLILLHGIPIHADTDHELRTDYYRNIVMSDRKTPSERTDAFFNLLNSDPSEIDNPVSFRIVKMCLTTQDYSRADSLLNMMSYHKQKSPSWKCDYLYYRGWNAFYQQDFISTMDYALTLLKEKKPDSLSYRNAEAYLLMTDLFNMMGNYSMGEKCASRSQEIIGNIDNQPLKKSLESLSITPLSNSLLNQGKFEKAFEVLKRGREITSDSAQLKAIYGTLGMLYASLGNKRMAEDYYKESMSLSGDPINSVALVLNFVGLKFRDNDISGADSIMQANSMLLDNVKNLNMRRGIIQARAYLQSTRNEYKKAYELSNQALAISDSAYISERDLFNKQISSRFEKQLEELENGEDSRYRIPFPALIGCVVFISVAIMGICFLIYKRRKDRSYAALEGKMQENHNLLTLTKEEASANIEEKNQKLMSMTMHMARISESLKKIENLTRNNKNEAEKSIKSIENILHELSSEDNLWEMFKSYFEQVNQSFFNNLFKEQPNLTNAEIRMAAFMLMNMTSKEIATLTNRSLRTVENIKYSLRKKLNISEPTEVFLRRIANHS